MAENLDAFIVAKSVGGLADPAVYDGATTIYGHFDNAYLEQIDGLIGNKGPVFLCKATDVVSDPTGKTLLVLSVTYRIRNIEPEDDGAFVRLILEKS
jgi:hypothetical protein